MRGLPALALAAAALCLAACTAPPAAPRPELATPPQWRLAGGSAALDRAWWDGFGDPVLSRLVGEALARNLDLRQAAARAAEARALARAQQGPLMPSVDVAAAAVRSRDISEVLRAPFLSTAHQSQIELAYEVDLWGRLAALAAAADASAQAVAAARDALALNLAGTVAASYLRLRSLDAQLGLAADMLGSFDVSRRLVQLRARYGDIGTAEAAQAEAAWQAAADSTAALQLAIARQEEALNLLLGRTPGPLERGLSLEALTVPPMPDAGLPSTLLQRRPDLQVAEQQLAASDAQFAAARAQLLPSLRLGAALARAGSTALPDGPFTLWSLGGSVLAPIFNGGRLRALAEASASRRDQALLAYERTVLTAFGEVETRLAASGQAQARWAHARAQREAVAAASFIAGRRLRAGYVSRFEALNAERAAWGAAQAAAQRRADLLESRVDLYRALGGGWSTAAP